MNTKLDEFKTEIKTDNTTTFNSLNIKISALTSNKSSSSYDQHYNDIIPWSLLNSTEKYSNASKFTKHLSSMNLEVNTLIHIHKWWDAIIYAF